MCWDSLAITLFMFIFVVCETQKPKNFFDHENFADQTQFPNNSKFLPFDNKLDNSVHSAMYNSKINKNPSNSNLTEFNEENKVLKIEKIE
jgi:hypothetical protein